MSQPSISFRISAVDRAGLLGQRRHDLRLGKQPDYVDPSRSSENRTLFIAPSFRADGEEFIDASRSAIEARTKRKTTKAAYWRTAIITFSREAQERLKAAGKLPHDEALMAFQAFGYRRKVKLLSVIFHGDEASPHYHASFEGVDDKGYSLRLSKADLSAEQDHAAMAFEPFGFVRGRRKADRRKDGEPASTWIHRSVSELHADLPKELAALRQKIAALEEKARVNDARAAKARTKAEADEDRASKAAKNLAIYERRATEARAEVERLTAEAKALVAKVESATNEANFQAARGDRAWIETEVLKAGLKKLEAAAAQKKTTIASLTMRLSALNAELRGAKRSPAT